MNTVSVRVLAALTLGALVLGIGLGASLFCGTVPSATAPATSPAKPEPKVLYWYDPMVPDKHFDKPGKSPFMDMELVPKYAEPEPVKTSTQKSDKPQILYWYDPMVPDKHFDKPGKSPFMDMELVPKYAEAATDEHAGTTGPKLVQTLGMRTAEVRRLPLQQEVEATGQLQFNERQQAMLQLRAGGFVERAWPLAVGDLVTAGDPIAELHIPEWLDPQNELLSQPVASNTQRIKTLRTRLALLGMPEPLIARVEKTRQPETRVTLTAPLSGVVTEVAVRTGMTLASGATLVHIKGIDTLWLDAAIPEALSSGLRPGDVAQFRSANLADPMLTGKVDQLLPTLDSATRTRIARILLDNPDGQLRPGTTGHVIIRSKSDKTSLFVPTEAIIRTGKHTRVMIADASGHVRPVTIEPGVEMGDQTQVRKGLREGQTVVASGQFLLDSEASFLGLIPETNDEEHDHD